MGFILLSFRLLFYLKSFHKYSLKFDSFFFLENNFNLFSILLNSSLELNQINRSKAKICFSSFAMISRWQTSYFLKFDFLFAFLFLFVFVFLFLFEKNPVSLGYSFFAKSQTDCLQMKMIKMKNPLTMFRPPRQRIVTCKSWYFINDGSL